MKATSVDPSTPFPDTCPMDAVASPLVPLDILKRRLSSAQSQDEKDELAEQIYDMETLMRKIDASFISNAWYWGEEENYMCFFAGQYVPNRSHSHRRE